MIWSGQVKQISIYVAIQFQRHTKALLKLKKEVVLEALRKYFPRTAITIALFFAYYCYPSGFYDIERAGFPRIIT